MTLALPSVAIVSLAAETMSAVARAQATQETKAILVATPGE